VSTAAGVARLAAAQGAVEVALGVGGRPVTARQPVGAWARSGGSLTATVEFGPYPERVEANEVLMWVAGEGPDGIRLTGELGLPPGVPFMFDLTLTVAEGG
jgi:predicted NUDIX family NTP pyrophosphohydrolase